MEQQIEKKIKQPKTPPTNIYGRGNEDNSKKSRGPRFNLYWIYAIIAVVLIGANWFQFSSDIYETTEQEFKEKMVAAGDVEKMDFVQNKQVIRVYIKSDSLVKAL